MKIALVENFGSDFFKARLRYAKFLKEKGEDVFVIVPDDGFVSQLESEGIKVIAVGSNIRGKNLKNKFDYAKKLKQIFKEQHFDLIHFYRLQPNIIGTFVAGLYTKAKVINHITGLGKSFTDKSFTNIFFQFIIKNLYRLNSFLFKPQTIFQNNEDIYDLGFKTRAHCIKGSAVNEDEFYKGYLSNNELDLKKIKSLLNINKEDKVFIFVSRLLKEKGVLELINGAIKANYKCNTPFVLLIIGWSDEQNPSSVSFQVIENYMREHSFIKFLGKRSDINNLLAISDVAILPTYYREGTPRFLLESMAMSKPIITTDMPGCNHLIPSGNNGILIPPKNTEAITNSMIDILGKDLEVLGNNSYNLYHNNFSEKIVYNSIYNIYNNIKL